MKYASGKIQNVPTSRIRAVAKSFLLNVAASPSAISEVATPQAASAAKQTISAAVAEPEAAVANASLENVLPEKAQTSEPSPSREIAPRAKGAAAASGDS